MSKLYFYHGILWKLKNHVSFLLIYLINQNSVNNVILVSATQRFIRVKIVHQHFELTLVLHFFFSAGHHYRLANPLLVYAIVITSYYSLLPAPTPKGTMRLEPLRENCSGLYHKLCLYLKVRTSFIVYQHEKDGVVFKRTYGLWSILLSSSLKVGFF